jgi:hypothetical protein
MSGGRGGTARSTTSSPVAPGLRPHSQARHRAWKAISGQFAWREIDPNAQPAPVDQINTVFSDMLILSPTANNEFRAGYNRRDRRETAFTQDQGWAKQLGIPNVAGGTFPYFNIGFGLTGLPSFQNIGEDFTVQDNFTKIISKHTFKAGYELIRTRYNATAARCRAAPITSAERRRHSFRIRETRSLPSCSGP